MGWLRRETETGTVQYICTICNDYHEFQEDFGERTFNENFIFCRRCGAKNGTGTPPTLTQQNEWVAVEERLPEEKQRVIVRCERVGTSVGWILWGRWMTDIGPHAGDVTHWMPLPESPKEDK